MDLLEYLEIAHLDGDQRKLAETIGMDAYKKLVGVYAGNNLYIPPVGKLCIKVRDKMIKDEYTGYNAGELAVKYGMTVQWVREIVGPAKPPIPGQVSLFDDTQEAI